MIETALILTLLAKYGPALINEIVGAWKDAGEPTAKELEELHLRVPSPDTYFPDAPGPGG